MSGIDRFASIIGHAAMRLELCLELAPFRSRGGAVLKMSRGQDPFVYEVEVNKAGFDLNLPGLATHAWEPVGDGDIHAQFVRWAENDATRTSLLTTHAPVVVDRWQGGSAGWAPPAYYLVARPTLMQIFRAAEMDQGQRAVYRIHCGGHTVLLPLDGTEPTITLGHYPHDITLGAAGRLATDLGLLRDLVAAHNLDRVVLRSPATAAA